MSESSERGYIMRKYEVYYKTGRIDWEYVSFGFSKTKAVENAKKEWEKRHKSPFPSEKDIYINVSPVFDV